MNTAQPYPEAEPTLYNIIEMMQRGFIRMEDWFDMVRSKFEEAEVRLGRIDTRLDHIDGEIGEMKQDVRNLYRIQHKLDIQDEDRADMLMNHEKRMIRLELGHKRLGNA